MAVGTGGPATGDIRQAAPRVRRRFPVCAFVWMATLPLAAQDCNVNDLEDAADIKAQRSEDCNANGIPDECEVLALRFLASGDVHDVAPTGRLLNAADLSGDGQIDLVVASRATGEAAVITVLPGRGDGTFETAVPYPVGDSLQSLALGDIDGDGDVDLVAADITSLVVMTNPGDDTFGVAQTRAVKPELHDVRLADWSHDGALDLVAVHLATDEISVWPNPGNGKFTDANLTGPTRHAVGDEPRQADVVDLNNDTLLDIAVVNRRSGDVSVLLGTGDGGFSAAVSYFITSRRPFLLRSGDLNHDGFPDLAVLSVASLFLLRNQGDGTFAVTSSFPSSGTILEVEDVDRDGDLDLIFGTGSRQLSIGFNRGDGEIGTLRVVNTDDLPDSLVVTDIDADGVLDLARLSSTGNDVSVLLGGEEEDFTLRRTDIPLFGCEDPRGCRPHSGAAGDFNGDGHIEVIGVNTGAGSFSITINAGTGELDFVGNHHFPESFHPQDMAAGDLDGDGDLDVVTPDNLDHHIYVHLNRGDATFLPSRKYRVGTACHRVCLADFDSDGLLDVVTGNEGADSVSFLFNSGDASFVPGLERDHAVGKTPKGVATGDFDGDGNIDVVAANYGVAEISVIKNEGGRDFAGRVQYPLLELPHHVATGDLNRDGHLDIATANKDAGTISVFFNLGDGTFPQANEIPLGQPPYSISTLDFNADGSLDLLTANQDANTLSILTGTGGGAFGRPRSFPTGSGLRFIHTGDLDHDGDLDLVTNNRGGLSLTVLYQDSPLATTDFVASICTPEEFQRLSAPAAAPVQGRVVNYLLPARDDPALVPGLFTNTRRFLFQEDLLRQSFPERFGDLPPLEYERLVARRESRDYFAGAIVRQQIVAEGELTGVEFKGWLYGFQVTADSSDVTEALSQAEVATVYATLRAVFRLEPLVYAPTSAAAAEVARQWQQPGFPIYFGPRLPIVEQPVDAPTFELEIPPETVACGVFVQGRDPGLEYERKSRVQLLDGVFILPTKTDSFVAELLSAVRVGATEAVAVPTEPGLFTVVRFPGPGAESTVYRFAYSQAFSLPNGERFEVRIPRLDFVAMEGAETSRRLLDNAALAAEVSLSGSTIGADPFTDVRYAPCLYESLPLWNIHAELADGSWVFLEERFREEPLDTGPASLVRAEVRIGTRRREVADYWKLVYSAFRHNTRVRYWILLDPPASVPGIPEPVRGIELVAPEPREDIQAEARYLGEQLDVLRSVELLSFSRTLRAKTAGALFRRGDANSSGTLDLTDAVALLEFLFRKGPAPMCRKSADANDDGRVNLLDAVTIYRTLFQGDSIPGPRRRCGGDATPDGLECQSFSGCTAEV